MGKNKIKSTAIKEELIEINNKKCINCTSCVMECVNNMNRAILKCGQNGKRGIRVKGENFDKAGCIDCGQCVLKCPTNAIHEKWEYNKIKNAINNRKYLAIIFDSSVKYFIGEEFSMTIGKDLGKELYTSARLMGFQKVYDNNIGINISALEEAKEFYLKKESIGNSPMFTSLCPSFYKWVKIYKPNMVPYISKSKTEQENLADFIKEFLMEKLCIPKKDIHITLVSNCLGLKGEKGNIDSYITIREYATMLKESGINLEDLPREECDTVIDEDEINRNYINEEEKVKYIITYLKKYLGEKVNYEELKFESDSLGRKFLSFDLKENKIRVACIQGIENIRKFMESKEWKKFDIIHCDVCNEGCLNGGGMPKIKRKPTINDNLCIGCGECINKCPVFAMSWSTGTAVKVDKEKCIDCGLCSYICRSKAINMREYYKTNKKLVEDKFVNIRKSSLKNNQKKNSILLEKVKFISLYEELLVNNNMERNYSRKK